jgi:hypothetical protein
VKFQPAVLAIVFVAALPAAADEIAYFNDFQTAVGAGWSTTGPSALGIDATPAPAAGTRRFLGRDDGLPSGGLGSEALTLSLTGLSAHTEVRVTFDLYTIYSWGGNAVPTGIDLWEFSVVGGPTLLSTTFSNIPTNPPYDRQSYPDPYPLGDHPAFTGASEFNSLGYTFGAFGPMDSTYHLSFTTPHVASALALSFAFLAPDQGLADEAWGLDNVQVA